MGTVDGRVVIVTGAGGAIARAHALAFAAEGARVVVNDIGVGLDGSPAGGGSAAQSVVDEITAAGGEAVANGSNIADWDQAAALVQTAVDTFGGLDVLVNNAGIVRDRMMANTSEEEFDAVIAVHLKGHFATMRHAASYWRGRSKEGRTVDARIINTSSGAGLQGSVGQGNYSAAKAGIAAMTLVASAEMGRYGVTVNAIAPSARTRMTEAVFAEMMATQDDDFDAMAPENISPLVVWLGSAESRDVTGKVFEVEGGKIRVAEGWAHGPQIDKGARWDPAELGPAVPDLLAQAPPPVPVYGAGFLFAPCLDGIFWPSFVEQGAALPGLDRAECRRVSRHFQDVCSQTRSAPFRPARPGVIGRQLAVMTHRRFQMSYLIAVPE